MIFDFASLAGHLSGEMKLCLLLSYLTEMTHCLSHPFCYGHRMELHFILCVCFLNRWLMRISFPCWGS